MKARNPVGSAGNSFVGRERELEELTAALGEARSGRGRFLLMTGEPGIGKTALAGVLGERAAGEGVRVVWGHCWEGGGAPPSGPGAGSWMSCVAAVTVCGANGSWDRGCAGWA